MESYLGMVYEVPVRQDEDLSALVELSNVLLLAGRQVEESYRITFRGGIYDPRVEGEHLQVTLRGSQGPDMASAVRDMIDITSRKGYWPWLLVGTGVEEAARALEERGSKVIFAPRNAFVSPVPEGPQFLVEKMA